MKRRQIAATGQGTDASGRSNLAAYLDEQKAVLGLLDQIRTAVVEHGVVVNWGHVGDLVSVRERLGDILDGFTAEPEPTKYHERRPRTYSVFNSRGRRVRVTIPESDAAVETIARRSR